jgi:hypothetical protein
METDNCIDLSVLEDYFRTDVPAVELLDAIHDVMIDYMMSVSSGGGDSEFAANRIGIMNSFYEVLRKSIRGNRQETGK